MKVFKIRRKVDSYWETDKRDNWYLSNVNWRGFELSFEKDCVRMSEWKNRLSLRLFCGLMKIDDFFYVNFGLTIGDFVMLMRSLNDWISTSDISFDVIINCEEFILSTFCIMS